MEALIKGMLSAFTIMGLPAIAAYIAQWLGFITLDGWKSWVLFIMGSMFLLARLVVFVVKSYQDIIYRNRYLKRMKK